jgi:putative endonuclease
LKVGAIKTQQTGQIAETKALKFLKSKGLQLVQRNYNCQIGEIDLIMCDKNDLVFVEVRARVNLKFGIGAESITKAKKQKIIKASLHYIIKNQLEDKFSLRFDVISIDGINESITWLKNAFDADGLNYF